MSYDELLYAAYGYLDEGDKQLRDAERKWKESGDFDDYIHYLHMNAKAGNLVEIAELDNPKRAIPEFDVKELSLEGESITKLVARIEKAIVRRIYPWTRKATATVMALKWANKLHSGNEIRISCFVRIPKRRARDVISQYTSISERRAFDGNGTAFAANLSSPTPNLNFWSVNYQDISGEPARRMVAHAKELRHNPGILIYSKL